jgi:hypothetical protein
LQSILKTVIILQVQYSKEILCAEELLRMDYVPLGAILLNGGIPNGYTLIKRKQKIYQLQQIKKD